MKDPQQNKKMPDPINKGIATVRIQFLPGRAANGVQQDDHGFADVDARTAQYLVSIGYATYAPIENKGDE